MYKSKLSDVCKLRWSQKLALNGQGRMSCREPIQRASDVPDETSKKNVVEKSDKPACTLVDAAAMKEKVLP